MRSSIARGARDSGATILEHTPVESIIVERGVAVGVRCWIDGSLVEVRADAVVNAAGMWAHELGRQAGATVPLHAAEHFYVVTEEIPGLPASLPVLRDQDACAYIKEDAGKLLVAPPCMAWPARRPVGRHACVRARSWGERRRESGGNRSPRGRGFF